MTAGARVLSAAVVLMALSGPGCRARTTRENAQRERQGAGTMPAGSGQVTPMPSDRDAWRALLEWPASCEEAYQASHVGTDAGLRFFELAPGLSLVEVVCAAGSYQPSQVYVRVDERSSSRVATLLRFTTYESPDGTSIEAVPAQAELWGQASVSPATRELSVLMLSRQLADCGIWTRYSVDTEPPELVAAASRLPCPVTPGSPAESTDGHAPHGWRPLRLSK